MTDTEPDKLIAIVCFLSYPLSLNLDPRVENTWKREKWTKKSCIMHSYSKLSERSELCIMISSIMHYLLRNPLLDS